MSIQKEYRVASSRLVEAANEVRSRGGWVTRAAIAESTGYDKRAVRNRIDREAGLGQKIYRKRLPDDDPPPLYLRAVQEMKKEKSPITQKSLAGRLGISLSLLKKRLRQYPRWRKKLLLQSEGEVSLEKRLRLYTLAARDLFDGETRITESSLASRTKISLDTVSRDFVADERLRELLFPPRRRKVPADD